MLLSDLASAGSLVSSVAVVASLVFLYFQVRQVSEQVKQAEKNQQAAIRQGRTNRIVEISLALMEPALAEAHAKAMRGDPDITVLQLHQFRSFMVASINHFEDSFYQHQDGLLNDVAFAIVVGGIRYMVSQPGYRAGWNTVSALRDGPFVTFMNRIVTETPLALPGDLLEQWHGELAAVRAAAGPDR